MPRQNRGRRSHRRGAWPFRSGTSQDGGAEQPDVREVLPVEREWEVGAEDDEGEGCFMMHRSVSQASAHRL